MFLKIHILWWIKRSYFIIKTLSLTAIPIISSVSPVLTETDIVKKELNNISVNYDNKEIKNNTLNYVLNGINKNKKEVKSLLDEIFDSISKKGKIDGSIVKKATHFQNVILNTGDSNSKQQREWTEWWGANLWVNLTRLETNNYLNFLRPYKDVSNFVNNVAGFYGHLSTIIDEFVRYQNDGALTSFLSILSSILTVGNWTLTAFNDFFNYYLIERLANQGKGVVSFRLTFGWIPTGIFPGYRVVEY